MTRAEDLGVLGLTAADCDAEDGPRRIRRAFLRLSRTRHPDKGGTKEAFQALSASYQRLTRREEGGGAVVEEEDARSEEGDAARDEEQHEAPDEEYGFWYDEYCSFFGHFDEDDFAEYEQYETYFSYWEESTYQRRKAWSEYHKQQVRLGRDFRDKKAATGSERCMFCGVNAPISEEKAKQHGIDWEEYIESTDVEGYPGYKTCWVCKGKHISVLTKSQACKKFAKRLDFTIPSRRTGREYHPVFWFLKCNKRSFHHQPETKMAELTKNSEYYWYPDLEREALALGWKPRGEQKESVPWKRKDVAAASNVVTPFALAKKRGRRDDDEGDRKPAARRLF